MGWALKDFASAGEVNVLSFANFSSALHGSQSEKNRKSKAQASDNEVGQMYANKTVDYSKNGLSTDFEKLKQIGSSLMKAGVFLEQEFKTPQDVEGAIVGSKIYVVQSRPQNWSVSL